MLMYGNAIRRSRLPGQAGWCARAVEHAGGVYRTGVGARRALALPSASDRGSGAQCAEWLTWRRSRLRTEAASKAEIDRHVGCWGFGSRENR